MLKFTAFGVVAAPATVQLRVSAGPGGGLLAGAPTPSRPLSDDEIAANLRYFTLGQRGPRGTPCDAAVLSGAEDRLDALGAAVAAARAWGLATVVLHVRGPAPPAVPGWIAEVGRVVRSPDEVAALATWRCRRTATVPLEGALDGLDATLEALLVARPERVVLTWPFPGAGVALADPRAVVALLDRWGPRLDAAGVPWQLKGIPACLAGDHAGHRSRTRNRWYVDADHQQSGALMFFPDVARWSKADVCRFCSLDAICDGVAAGVDVPLRPR